MADEFDVEEFLEKNAVDIRDYDSYLTELQNESREFISGTYAGGFGLYAPATVSKITMDQQFEIIQQLVIDQQRLGPYKEWFNNLTDQNKMKYLKDLVGFNIVDLGEVSQELLTETDYEDLLLYVTNYGFVDQSKILEGSAGQQIVADILEGLGFDGADFDELPTGVRESVYQQALALIGAPGSAAFAQFYGYDREDAVFNFDYQGGTLNQGPVYRQGMASSLLASMSENEVAEMQTLLIEAGHLSPFASYTLFDPSDAATVNALGKAMATHNKRFGATPVLDRQQQAEILSGIVSVETTNVLIGKLTEELKNDVSVLGEEERTRLYGINELTLAAATERADTIAGQVIGRDVDMVTAGKLAEVYKNIYNEKYKQVVDTALQKMETGRAAELNRIKAIQGGEQGDATRFVGLPASAETESTVPTQEEMAQQAATFAKLDFSRRLKDTYFAQEIEDSERRAAIAQASIGFNTALRSLGG